MERLSPYPAYKDSGVPWLGQIPAHWTVMRAKNVFARVDIRSELGNEELLTVSSSDGVVPRREKTVTMFMAESYVGHKLCWPGDLVINSLWAWAKGLGFARHHGIVSSAYGVYRLLPHYADYWSYLDSALRSDVYQWEFQVRSKGIWVSRLQLTDEAFFDMPVILPAHEDAQLIVRYLDHADRQIRRLIRAKRRTFELLNEQKQAIIHQAVTRGLDPNVPLKPSGVEWLGDIPAHWSLVRFSDYIDFQEGPGIMASDFRDEGVPLLRIANLKPNYVDLAGCNFLQPEMVEKKWKHFRLEVDDLLISSSASTGLVTMVDRNSAGSIPYTGIIRLRPARNSITRDFIRLLVRSNLFFRQIDLLKTGSTIQHFGPSHLRRMRIVLPPLSEQQQIREFVNAQHQKLDQMLSIVQSTIDNLREYRIRLIADVVTGKLDVRAAAWHLPGQVDEAELWDEEASEDDEEIEVVEEASPDDD